MDANGQRFWLALGGSSWEAEVPGQLRSESSFLALGSVAETRTFPEEPSAADAALEIVPMAADAFGTFARYDPATKTIRGSGAIEREDAAGARRPERVSEMPVLIGGIDNVTDLALGFDGLLYIACAGHVRVWDPRGRFSENVLSLPGFVVWRLAADPGGFVWALDRVGKKLAKTAGRPWPPPMDVAEPPASAFLPVQDNPDPLRLVLEEKSWIDADEDPVAIACRIEGGVTILFWSPTGARLRQLAETQKLNAAALLADVTKPFSLAWISNDEFAVIAPGVPEALVFPFIQAEVHPSGHVFPMRDHDGGPFLHGVNLPVQYGCPSDAEPPDDPVVSVRPLVSVSLAAFAPAARGRLRTPFDSGVNDCAWHRLYIEADVPPDTSLTIYAAISNDRTAPSSDAEDEWHPHHLGIVPNRKSAEPQAAWVSSPSEIPGQRGFTGRPIEKNRSGLFTVLLQKSDRPVRTMRGRFLHLSLELRGNLRSTPKIFALRAYAPRFSYQDKYLPALYRETLFSSEGGEPGPGRRSTPADFLGRFIANFEGILTPLEDSIASSWMLTDPRSAPSEALDWLGSWIGISFEPWYPAQSRRKHIQVAPELFRQRGTLRGLEQALDVATDGGVRAGRVIVVEDHWFRRTLQTVLGLELDRDDPLLGRPVLSGNSKVGETLFLSEEGFAKKFLALFDASIQLSAADRRVVDEFFASLAFRVTVIIHDQASPEERKVVQRVAALEIPAHVSLRLREGDREFMLGLNSLLGVDSYLRADRPATPVEVDSSAIGGGGLLIRPPSFDPRLEGTS